MADMRQIFTYPTGLATDYIDPNYVGDATSGLTRRIDELLAGTYKAWLNPLVITATTSQVMQNISKFGSYYENQSYAGHLSRYDFWNKPLVVATKKLIDSVAITSANHQNTPMLVTTGTAHEFEDGMKIITSGVDGTWGTAILVGDFPNMYAKVISSTELQVATDSDLTQLINWTSNATNFTLNAGALQMAGRTGITNIYNAWIDLSQLDDPSTPLVIPDGQSITFNSSTPSNSGLTNVVKYLKNTATSATDNTFELWNDAAMTNNRDNIYSLTYPLQNTVSATLNETNPGTITTSRALADHELDINITSANAITWSDNRTSWGDPNGGSGPTLSGPLVRMSATPTSDVDFTYTVSSYDFAPNTPTHTATFAFYPMYQNLIANPLPWAQVTNGRLKINKPITAIPDGTQVTISGALNFPSQYPNNPYYLKNITALETASYFVFDVYKNVNLTNIYGPSDYAPPEHLATNLGVEGSGVNGASNTHQTQLIFRTDLQEPTLVMKSNTNNPDWGISVGDTINSNYSGGYQVYGYSATPKIFNDRTGNFPAPSLDQTALLNDPSIGAGIGPAIWIHITDSGIINSTNGNQINWGGDSKTPAGIWDIVDTNITSGNWRLFRGGYWNYAAQAYPLPSLLDIAFEPVPFHTPIYGQIADIKVSASILSDSQQRGINFPTQFPAVNNNNEYRIQSGLWNTFALNSGNYTAGFGTVYLGPTTTGNHPKYYKAYSDFARTIPLINPVTGDFSPSQRQATGPDNYVDPNGDIYPTNVDVTATNVVWDIGSITWYDGQSGELSIAKPNSNLTQTVYIKNISSTEVEFYFDSALTTAYTSANFITDWATYGEDAGSTGVMNFRTKEPVSQYSPVHPSPGNYSYGYTSATMGTMNTTRLTNSTDVFDMYTYSPENGTATGAESVISSTSTGVDPFSFEANIDIILPIVDSTTGQIGPATGVGTNPYEIDTVELILPGNETFTYQTGASTTSPGAKVNTSKYWDAGSTVPSYYTNGATSATFNTTVDTNGYLQSVTLVEEPDAEGRYPTGEDITLFIEALPDTYTAPVLTPAQQADVYDTHDEWTTDGYNALKQWPDNITPASASIVYNSPTTANISQSGVKYTRSSAHTKWILEVEYPPMKAEDFQKFHAIAQAAHGQSTPFFFNLRNKDSVSLLWADMMESGSSFSGSAINTSTEGSATLFLEGLTASDATAFREGEVFISSENENGSLHTAIGAAASNAFGEAKVRMPWPLRAPVTQSDLVYKNPSSCIVTLNSDNFEYSVDVNNYYTVSVAFDLDNWK